MPGGYIEVAKAAVTIVPTMEGAQQTITDELSGAGAAAGKTAGKATGGAMVTSLGNSMSKAGGTLTKSVTAPLAAIGAASVAAFKSVDAGLDIIVTKTGASGDALEGMNDVFRNIARTMPADFESIGSAVGEVNTRFGLTGDALESLSRQFLMFAEINDQDVSTSVDRVADVLAAFGMEATEAGDLLDAFNVVGQNTGIDVGTLADLLSSNAAQFQTLGWSAYDAAAFLGQVTMAGLDSSSAIRGLQSAMQYATAHGQDMSDVLSDFQMVMESNIPEADKLAAAYELFGTKAGAAIYNAVSQGTLDLTSFNGSLDDFSGSVANTFEAAQDPLDGFKEVTNALSLAGAELVESAGPAIVSAVEMILPVITGLTDAWTQLSPGMQKAILYAGLFAAAAGPVMSTVGPLVSKLGGLVSKFGGIGSKGAGAVSALTGVGGAAGDAASPVANAAGSFGNLAGQSLKLVAGAASVWLIAQALGDLADTAIKITEAGPEAEIAMGAMTAAIAGVIALVEGMGSTSASFSSLAGSALELGATAGSIWLISDAFSSLADTAIRITESGTEAEIAMGVMVVAIGALMGVAAALGPALDAGALGIISFGAAVAGIGAGIDLACEGIAKLIDAVGEASLKFAEAAPALSQAFTEAMDAISESVVEILGGVGDLATTFADCSTTISESFGTAVTAVSDGVATVINAFGDSLSKVLDAVAGIFDSMGQAALDAGTGFSMLSDAVIHLVNDTGVVDLASTLGSVASGIKDINKQAKNSKDAVAPLDQTTAALGRFSDALGDDLDYAITTAETDLSKLQDLFDGTVLQLPEVYIPTPHFNVFSGAAPYGVNGQGAVPYITVQWYAQAAKQGAVFDSPQIIGVGDASEPEFLLGRSALRDQLEDMVQSGGSSPVVDAIAAMAAEIVAAINDKDSEISIDGQVLARILSRYQRQNARAFG
jgi:phage-related minor tail protein